MTRRLVLAATACAALALPQAALAGTASVGLECGPQFGLSCSGSVHYVADPGEQNSVTISSAGPRAYTVVDAGPGTEVDEGDGCEFVDETTARCTIPEASNGETVTDAGATMSLGDLQDYGTLEVPGRMFGGSDIDVLRAKVDAPVLLQGDSGNDRLIAYAGDQLAYGNAGNDKILLGAGDDDAFGGAGIDSIVGGSGDDHLVGGAGHDRLTGGSGRDRIDARDHAPDRVSCGSGRDSASGDRSDKLIGCEVKRAR